MSYAGDMVGPSGWRGPPSGGWHGPSLPFVMRTGMWDPTYFQGAYGAHEPDGSYGVVVADPQAPGWTYDMRSDGTFRVLSAPRGYERSAGAILRPGSPGYAELQSRVGASSFSDDPYRYTDATIRAFKSGDKAEGWSRVAKTALDYAPEAIDAASRIHLSKHKTRHLQKHLMHLRTKLAKTRSAKHRAALQAKIASLEQMLAGEQAQLAQASQGMPPAGMSPEGSDVSAPSGGAGIPWVPIAVGGALLLGAVLLLGK